jgi:hypothetical protein
MKPYKTSSIDLPSGRKLGIPCYGFFTRAPLAVRRVLGTDWGVNSRYHPTGTCWVYEKWYGRMKYTIERAEDIDIDELSLPYFPIHEFGRDAV